MHVVGTHDYRFKQRLSPLNYNLLNQGKLLESKTLSSNAYCFDGMNNRHCLQMQRFKLADLMAIREEMYLFSSSDIEGGVLEVPTAVVSDFLRQGISGNSSEYMGFIWELL